MRTAFKVRRLKFVRLKDGHISVRAVTPPGTRWDYRRIVRKEDFEFNGTRYNPETVAGITREGLLRSAASMENLVMAGTVSLVQNLWEFGTNPAEGKTFWDRTVKNREFWVSTAVDAAVSLAVGVAAAAVVSAFVTATTPLWLVVGATALVGIGLGAFVDGTGAPYAIKKWLNNIGK